MSVVIGSGSFLLFLALATNVLAFLVPYWVENQGILGIGKQTFGLWGSCSCRWYYSDFDDVQDSKLEDWFQATQWMYAIAVVLMVLALVLVASASCFCQNKYGQAMSVSGALTLSAAILIAIAVVLFGVKGHEERDFKLDGQVKLIWGMWLAVAGCVLAVVTAIAFIVQGMRMRENKGWMRSYQQDGVYVGYPTR